MVHDCDGHDILIFLQVGTPVHLSILFTILEARDRCTSNSVGCTIYHPLLSLSFSQLFYLWHSERVGFHYSHDHPYWFGTVAKDSVESLFLPYLRVSINKCSSIGSEQYDFTELRFFDTTCIDQRPRSSPRFSWLRLRLRVKHLR
jgi:hypothetical protein